jgi:hypothetical protein
MPMRGELSPPASRAYWKVGADDELTIQQTMQQTWQEVCDAFGKLDPVILLFSGTGLLLSACLLLFDPASAFTAAALSRAF